MGGSNTHPTAAEFAARFRYVACYLVNQVVSRFDFKSVLICKQYFILCSFYTLLVDPIIHSVGCFENDKELV